MVGEKEIKLAVVHGLAHAKKLLKAIDEGEAYYDLLEVMTCPGGCVGGAGQPHGLMPTKKERTEGLYNIDRSAPFKRAERTPVVKAFLDQYGEEKCHELLHVHYPDAK